VSYFFIRREFRNILLLFASLFFYAWGEPHLQWVMWAIIVINYFSARGIDKYRDKSKIILTATIIANLGFLAYFKYCNFFIENIVFITHWNIRIFEITLPLGISFFTFQAMSYVIDVYRKEVVVQKNFYKLALYISCFPQLVAGPIVKYHDFAWQIDARQESFEKLVYGVKRFILGLSKKMLIANVMGEVADKVFSISTGSMGVEIAWIGALCYTLQIYYDFSGYSDMAIGLGMMFGLKFPENFNYPYISKSITEFWRRWHISLSTWFKQYLYFPLGGNRKSSLITYRNLLIVFLITGFWHGASWNFVVWGLWYGLFLVFEKVTGLHKKEGNIFVSVLQHIYTLLIVIVGWVMFRADNLTYAWDFIKKMFGFGKDEQILFLWQYYLDRLEIGIIIIGIVCAMPVFRNLPIAKDETQKSKTVIINLWLLILFVFSAATMASSTYNPFIYFRF
jgi:alginate O-acetyltransferase complex protein AlgI